MSPENLRFDHFELQTRERRLTVNGTPAALGARAFDLLVTLVQHPGQLLTKADLLDAVWPGLVVEEANLSVQVASLRKVLGGDLIATIPGRGYRFTGVPSVVAGPAALGGAAFTSTAPVALALPVPQVQAQAPALIGRDTELGQIEAALGEPGLVTLTGPGGVGKTSLARVLAARCVYGAVWVDLGPLTQGEQVLAALARALATPLPAGEPWPTLQRALAGRLLVLDNAEHLVDAVALLVTQLLQTTPAQQVLVTSQQPLRVQYERVLRIGPLALPLDSDTLDLHHGAIALFVERARAADHRFHLGPEQLPLLRVICRHLDGIPLALEMAAARIPVLGLAALRHALVQRFEMLRLDRHDVQPRQRTLQAALDWSYGLLAPSEQRLFCICGVFSGGFTLDLLVQVATGSPDATDAGAAESRWAVIDALSNLIDCSLVSANAGEPPRYALLETMHAYTRQRLLVSGDEATLRSNHARVLAELARRANGGSDSLRALLLAEHDNLREAIGWALTNEPERAIELVIGVASVARFAAWRLEALRWLDACEGVVEAGELPALLRAQWWCERARLWLMKRDPRARAMSERALDLYQGLGDDRGEFEAIRCAVRAHLAVSEEVDAHCAGMRTLHARHPEWPPLNAMQMAGADAWVCQLHGDYEGKLRHRRAEAEFARHHGWLSMVDGTDANIVLALNQCGRHEEALERSNTMLARLARSGSSNAAYAWHGHITALLELKRFDEFRLAAVHAADALRQHGLPLITDTYALFLAQQGRADDAARMIGHAQSAYLGMVRDPLTQDNLARAERLARASLDDTTFSARVAQGRDLDDAQADRLALEPADPLASPATYRAMCGRV